MNDSRHDDLVHLISLAQTLAEVLASDDGQGLMAGVSPRQQYSQR